MNCTIMHEDTEHTVEIFLGSVNGRLLERFQLTAKTLLHHVVHSFGLLETKIHICSIALTFVTQLQIN